jgi:hypothetical protein
MYGENRFSISRIAALSGTRMWMVRKWLVEAGMPIRSATEMNKVRCEIGRPSKDWLYQKYIKERLSLRQIGNIVGKDHTTISRWLKEASIPLRHGSEAIKTQWENNDERRRKLANETSERMKGLVPWNKGLTKEDDPRVASSSERMKLKNPARIPEVMQKIREKNSENFSGRGNPMFGKASPFSKILKYFYKGIRMRSYWEVKTAEYMDRIGLGWLYEPDRFDLGNRTYAPDFRLETGDYVEVKGWFHERHQETIRKFRELYPQHNLIIISRLEELPRLKKLVNSNTRRDEIAVSTG